MPRHALPYLLLLLLAASGCTERGGSTSGSASGSASRSTAAAGSAASGSTIKRITGYTRIRQTKDMTAPEYLQRQIKFYSERLAKAPKQHIYYAPLAGLYQALSHHNAELWPHQKAIELCEAAVRHGARAGSVALIKARSLLALHRLPAAREALKVAEAAKKRPSSLLPLHAEIALQVGKYAEARALLEKLAKLRRGKAAAASLLAVLDDTLGAHDKAAAGFSEALRVIERNPSGRAWIRVMRGISLMHRGRFAEAKADFKEAVALSPYSVLAAEHLGEIEMRLGHLDRAIAIYQGVLGRSKNPEYQAAIAEVYRKKGDAKAAARHEAIAAKGFAAWLARFPEAAYGHAVHFYLGVGNDPKRAVTLAAANAKLRPSSAALVMLAEAQLAAGDKAGAKAAIDKALAMPAKNAELFWVASKVYGPSSKRGTTLRAQALAINPKQASM